MPPKNKNKNKKKQGKAPSAKASSAQQAAATQAAEDQPQTTHEALFVQAQAYIRAADQAQFDQLMGDYPVLAKHQNERRETLLHTAISFWKFHALRKTKITPQLSAIE